MLATQEVFLKEVKRKKLFNEGVFDSSKNNIYIYDFFTMNYYSLCICKKTT